MKISSKFATFNQEDAFRNVGFKFYAILFMPQRGKHYLKWYKLPILFPFLSPNPPFSHLKPPDLVHM